MTCACTGFLNRRGSLGMGRKVVSLRRVAHEGRHLPASAKSHHWSLEPSIQPRAALTMKRRVSSLGTWEISRIVDLQGLFLLGRLPLRGRDATVIPPR